MRENENAFHESFTFMLSNEDKVVIDGPHGIKRKLTKFLKEHPENKYGKTVDEIFDQIKDTLIQAPALVSSVNIDDSD